MAASIFLSHASKDLKTAETICSALEGRGLECWMAQRDVRPGENFQEAIVRAIRAAKVMLFVFSANSNNSDEVKKEIALAGSNKLFVIPVRVEDVTPNEAFAYELATRQWIDLFSDWETALDQLTVQIEAVIAAHATAAGEAAPAPTSAKARRAAGGAAAPADAAAAAAVTAAAVGPAAAAPEPAAPSVNVDALYEEANAKAKAGEYDPAIAQYGEVLAHSPDHSGALNNRGNAYHAKGMDDQALADFDRAISLKPDFAAAYCNRGNVLQARGEFDRAIRDYTVALQLQPDFPVALENRARAYERKGLHDMARKDHAAATALRSGAAAHEALRQTTPTAGAGLASAPGGAPPTAGPGLTNNSRIFLIAGGGVIALLLVIAVAVALMKPHPTNQIAALSSVSAAPSAQVPVDSSQVNSATAPAGPQLSIADANSKADAAFQAKDFTDAMIYYAMAANQGDAYGQYSVGWLYDKGEGVPQDYGQAMHYYVLAANQGQPSAEADLADLYYYGHGVAVDYVTAAHWYQLSANQGNAYAEYSIGWMYGAGQGMAQDMGEARIWMAKSAAQGRDDAKVWLAQHQ